MHENRFKTHPTDMIKFSIIVKMTKIVEIDFVITNTLKPNHKQL
jgi:hypothetical protein